MFRVGWSKGFQVSLFFRKQLKYLEWLQLGRIYQIKNAVAGLSACRLFINGNRTGCMQTARLEGLPLGPDVQSSESWFLMDSPWDHLCLLRLLNCRSTWSCWANDLAMTYCDSEEQVIRQIIPSKFLTIFIKIYEGKHNCLLNEHLSVQWVL